MRKGTIIIGGKPYDVKGLSVSQSLEEDILSVDKKHAGSVLRMRRVAIALQNGDAYIPDPANPSGSIGTKGISIENIIKWLDGDESFESVEEWYNAEIAANKLSRTEKPKTNPDEEAPGESIATE
jgi:hypothetical protein